jgi:hypothetical protein
MMNAKIAGLDELAKKNLGVVNEALKNAQTDSDVAGTELLLPMFAKPAAEHEIQMRSREAKKLLEIFKLYDNVLSVGITLEWNEVYTSGQNGTMTDEFRDSMKDLSKFLGQTVRGMKNKVSPLDEPAADGAAAANDTSSAIEKAA